MFCELTTYFTRVIIWIPKPFLLLQNVQTSTFFNATGKSFQRIAPNVLTISKQNLLILMFCLFMVTLGFRF